MRPRLVWQQQWAAGSKVRVGVTQSGLIIGRKVITHYQRRAFKSKLEYGVAIVPAFRGRVEGSVSGRHVDIAAGIGTRASVASPACTKE